MKTKPIIILEDFVLNILAASSIVSGNRAEYTNRKEMSKIEQHLMKDFDSLHELLEEAISELPNITTVGFENGKYFVRIKGENQ